MNSSTSSLYSIVIWAMVFAIPTAIIWDQYRRRHRKVDLSDTPVLMAYYTDDANIFPAVNGKIGDLEFTAFATSPKKKGQGYQGSALLYLVTMPFTTNIHLLGIPKKSGAVQLDPSGYGSLMERVGLEGDYDNYFNLFCEKGMQTQARYVMDPEAMEFTVDFCQSHCWEITGNELYFAHTSGMKTDQDPSTMYADLPKFIEQIKPALTKDAIILSQTIDA